MGISSGSLDVRILSAFASKCPRLSDIRTRSVLAKFLFLTIGFIVLTMPLASGGAIAIWDFDTGGAWNGTTFPVNANSFTSAAVNATPTLNATTSAGTTMTKGAGTSPTATTAIQFTAGSGGGAQNVSGGTFTLTLTAARHLDTFSITYDALSTGSGTANNN